MTFMDVKKQMMENVVYKKVQKYDKSLIKRIFAINEYQLY